MKKRLLLVFLVVFLIFSISLISVPVYAFVDVSYDIPLIRSLKGHVLVKENSVSLVVRGLLKPNSDIYFVTSLQGLSTLYDVLALEGIQILYFVPPYFYMVKATPWQLADLKAHYSVVIMQFPEKFRIDPELFSSKHGNDAVVVSYIASFDDRIHSKVLNLPSWI